MTANFESIKARIEALETKRQAARAAEIDAQYPASDRQMHREHIRTMMHTVQDALAAGAVLDTDDVYAFMRVYDHELMSAWPHDERARVQCSNAMWRILLDALTRDIDA